MCILGERLASGAHRKTNRIPERITPPTWSTLGNSINPLAMMASLMFSRSRRLFIKERRALVLRRIVPTV